MKTRLHHVFLILALFAGLHKTAAQGTAFTYQGRLNDGANPANGSYDFRFRLASDALGNNYVGGPLLTNAISVINGLFLTTLDFGAGNFTGSNYWLEVDVKTNNAGSYTALSPLQALTTTPYAIFANAASNVVGKLPAAQLTGTIPDGSLPNPYGSQVSFNNGANTYVGNAFVGNGASLNNLNASALAGGTVPLGRLSGITSSQLDPATWQLATNQNGGNATNLNGLNATNFWQTDGNNVLPGQFLGSTNNQPVEIWVNGGRTLRLEPGIDGDGAPNVIGGSSSNFVSAGVTGATIAGGGQTNYSGYYQNIVTADFGAVSGGFRNTAGYDATVAGGAYNTASGDNAMVGGGANNTANDEYATVSGGEGNTASGDTAAVSGGQGNEASNQYATVGGGVDNTASGLDATVPGGADNIAGGQYSFAAGQQAQATNTGAFVWADSQNAVFTSTINDSFNVRAKGGVNFVTSGAGITLDGAPLLTSGGGSGITIQQNSSGAPNVIGGSSVNSVSAGVVGATIAGGGATNYLGNPQTNTVMSNFGTVSGGEANTAFGFATVGGGQFNIASGGQATVGGGSGNIASGTFATVGGGEGNIASSFDGTVGGGNNNHANGLETTVGGGKNNTANSDSATVSGGYNNTANGSYATVGGGSDNAAVGTATVGGGFNNNASGSYAAVAGGRGNIASGTGAFIGGGGYDGGSLLLGNIANGNAAVVSGGITNQATNTYATVPGGAYNIAGGQYSFAAGQQARALHQGAFVWADSQNATFSSTANDQFLIRAQGGVGINMNNPNGASLYVRGNRTNGWPNSVGWFENTSTATNTAPALRVVCDGGTNLDGALSVSANGKGLIAEFGNASAFVVTITNDGTIYSKGLALTSDRNAKEHFTALNEQTVLAKVVALPVTEWNYKDDAADKKHIGPMAQDFQAAFGLNGGDDKHISVVDEGGVALAAIQGLNQKLSDELAQKQTEITELKQRLDTLERFIRNQKSN